MNELITELLKTGGPVALLIVLGFFERRALIDKHYRHMESFNMSLVRLTEVIKELATVVKERLHG